MLQQIDSRRISLGLSVRQLATQLSVPPSLLSMVLNGRRNPSKQFTRTLKKWLQAPAKGLSDHHPAELSRQFIEDRSSHLAASTVQFYKGKLVPFVMWCEKQQISDVRAIRRTGVSAFLSHVRKGRSKPLNAGGIKLYHQTLKTYFNFVGETCDVSADWMNPVDGIKVKGSQAQTLEYSDTEIAQMFKTIDSGTDGLLRLRNRAMLTVLLNSAVRASELLSMNVNDIGDKGRVMVTGKGSKQRVVTIGESGLSAVNSYLDFRVSRTSALWQTHESKTLSKGGLRSLFTRLEARNPGIFTDGLYAHRFRHTAITRLLRARVPLRSVQRYAGHTDPQTTLRYAQAIDADEAILAVETGTFIK
jgi:site-specific recombinase XerD